MQAVRITLEASPVILAAEQRMESAAGALTTAGGQFNTVGNAKAGYAINQQPYAIGGFYNDPSDRPVVISESNTINYQLGLSKLFRTGIQVAPTASTARLSPNQDNTQAANVASTVNLSVIIPLMRGLGEKAAAAQEIAAGHGFDRARYQLWQTMAEEIQKSVTAYWNYVAAVQRRDVLQAAVDRNTILVENVRRLAEGDQKPWSDINNFTASLAQAESDKAAAEQSIVSTRFDLGMAMGVPADHLNAIPLPSDSFPIPSETSLKFAKDHERHMIDYAYMHRSDLLAADQNILYNSALMGGAENALKPQVNVQLNMGYQGLNTNISAPGMFTAFGTNVPGFTGGANVSYEFPFANEKAIGQMRQVNASLTESQILRENLARSIVGNVQVATNNLVQRWQSLSFAKAGAESRKSAFHAEQRKLEAGMADPVSVNFVEDRWTQAQIQQVQAELALATAAIQYRFATGSLFAQGDESKDLDVRRLTSIPIQSDVDMRAK